MILIAQIFGIVAIIFWIISVQRKEKKNILFNQMMANIFYTIQYFLLGVFSASSMNFTSSLRSLVFYSFEKKNKEITKVWLIVFISLVLISGFLTWENGLSIIPIVITLFYTISVWMKDSKWIRFVFLIAAFVWIYYNFSVGAYICILGNFLEITSGIIALIRFNDKKSVKIVTYNKENIKENEIDEVVHRAKALLVDKNNNILLGYCNYAYQFPGGHLEKDETVGNCLIREVKEETGIDISKEKINYFMEIDHYTRNYRNTGKNRLNKIYYFMIRTDKEPNLNETSYVEYEKDGNYTLKKVNVNDIERLLLSNSNQNEVNELIVMEMIDVINEFKRRYYGKL